MSSELEKKAEGNWWTRAVEAVKAKWDDAKRELSLGLGLQGKLYRIKNQDAKMGEADEYYAVQIEMPENHIELGYAKGEEIVALFTQAELETAMNRAKKNPEDVAAFLEEHWFRDHTG